MEENLEVTVMSTPKPTACSTVHVKRTEKKNTSTEMTSFNSSSGILSINDSNFESNLIHDRKSSISGFDLEQQRLLANNSLQRANKVAAIPSKYFRPNLSTSSFTLGLGSESTINESDLLKTPKNTSTPRCSVASNENEENIPPRLSSLGDSIAQLSLKLSNNYNVDTFGEEFEKALNVLNPKPQIPQNSFNTIFVPGEEAASKLLADEMSWRKKYDLPLKEDVFRESMAELPSAYKMSMGEFFQQRSDNISDLKCLSPEKTRKPVPLIDESLSFNKGNEDEKHSLHNSEILRFLDQIEDTPRKAMSFLCNQHEISNNFSRKTDIEQSSLPVSKNSSYTSSYSDNEALKCIVNADKDKKRSKIPKSKELKKIQSSPTSLTPSLSIPPNLENVSDVRRNSIINDHSPSTSSSGRSSSALTSLPSGKLPIETTRGDLIWGCVRIGKCVTKDFFLRNKSSKTLRIQCSVSGHQFKIRKDNRQDSDPLRACKFVLHGHESRPIIISFIPTQIGAAIDELVFTPLDSNLVQTKKQCISLWGYGGYNKIEFCNGTKDTSGKFWLPLGKLSYRTVIEQSFLIKNTGTLASFTYISFRTKQAFAFTNVQITPSFFTLLPNEQKNIKIVYTPNASDCNILQQQFNGSSITNIGSLEIASGSEVLRGRLRRLCRKCEERGLELDSLSKVLREKIKGEVMPNDLLKFKENSSAIKDILEMVDMHEVILTLEQDPDQTLVAQYQDESAMYQTLATQESTIVMDNTAAHGSCKLEPSHIILSPPTKSEDCLYLISETTKVLHFEVNPSPVGLEITPSSGVLCAGDTIILKLKYLKNSNEKLFKVQVYVEDEVFESNVKVIKILRTSTGHR